MSFQSKQQPLTEPEEDGILGLSTFDRERLCKIRQARADELDELPAEEIRRRAELQLLVQTITDFNSRSIVPNRVTPSTAAVKQIASPNIFRRDGDTWLIAFQGATKHVKDAIGFRHIRLALQNAGKDMPVKLFIEQSCSSVSPEQDCLSEESSLRPQEVLDAKAKQSCKAKLIELNERMEVAQNCGAIEEAAKCEEEIEKIQQYLRKAQSKHGRSRKFNSSVDRARKSVSANITRAIYKLRESLPDLAQHFEQNIDTGSTIRYRDTSIDWTL